MVPFLQMSDPACATWLKIWLLDMTISSTESAAALVAAVNPQESRKVHFAVGILSVASDSPPAQFRHFHTLPLGDVEWDGQEHVPIERKIAISSAGGDSVFVYDKNAVMCCKMGEKEEPDK